MSETELTVLTMERGRSLADLAYKEMVGLIRSGHWPARSRLPSETDLARRFGVSRPIIRQALARLRDAGLVQSRQGSGSFVLGEAVEPDQTGISVQFPAIGSVADLEAFLGFREGLEGEAAATAALRRTDHDVTRLHQLSTRILESRAPGDDFAFHLAVAAASGNPFYSNTLSSLQDQLLLGMQMAWNFSSASPGTAAIVAEQHSAVAKAIEERDPEAARLAMRRHLEWTRQKLMRGNMSPQIS